LAFVERRGEKKTTLRFQLIEWTAHSFATIDNCSSDAHCYQPKHEVAARLSSDSSNQESNKRLNRDRRDMWIRSPERILAQQKVLGQLQHPKQELET